MERINAPLVPYESNLKPEVKQLWHYYRKDAKKRQGSLEMLGYLAIDLEINNGYRLLGS